MSINNDARPYTPPSADYVGGPLFGGIDIFAGILAVIMILGPMTAGAIHANPQGWGTAQHQRDMR